jgi:hypothetical protein
MTSVSYWRTSGSSCVRTTGTESSPIGSSLLCKACRGTSIVFIQLTEVEALGSLPPQVVVPRSNLEMESQCPWPAFHNLHHVPEFDWHVRALGRGHDHEAAAERLGMLRLNAIPHFLSRNGFADECIAGADFTEALHMLLS